ncbi:MAG: TonB-dependent receptor [Deltaproteobacteria bacterium]|nr:TonB-dependent receptor [Deltaproteobacteria bacterium]MDQ3299115.1 carboxypeptidase regulatory-like domain-containing protein [Myxococcota bacterium]
MPSPIARCTFWITSLLAVAHAARADADELAQRDRSSLSGSVVDEATGDPVAGAIVATGSLETTTAADGRFELAGVPSGWIDLVVVADGYEPLVERARRGVPLRLLVVSSGELGDSELITIEEKRELTGQAASYDVGRDVVRTLPGSGNDALKSLQSLPGAARVPFGLGGLVLRGFAPRDTNVFLDGIEVPILYHFGGLASFFPSTMIESMELVSSGYGARYGRGQGGIVDIRSRPGRTDRWAVGGEVSLLDASVRAEGPVGGGNVSLGVRRSFVDAVLAAAPAGDLALAPRYLDSQLRWQSRSGKLTGLVFGADDGLALATTTTTLDARQSFVRAGLRYTERRDDLQLSVVPWLGFDRSAIIADENQVIRSNVTAAVRATVQRDVPHGFVAAGLDVQSNRYGYKLVADAPALPTGTMPLSPGVEGSRWSADLGMWTEVLHRFAGDKLAIQPGLRGERFGLTREWALDPRITFRQQPTANVTFAQSIGRYHQPALATSVDYQLPGEPFRASRAWQASAGINVVSSKLGGDITANAFGASLHDLPVDVVSGATPYASPGSAAAGGAAAASRQFTEEQLGSYSYRANRGRGRTYGFETMIRRRVGVAQGWVAYTFARSYRQGDPWALETYAPYVLDQPHVLTALATVPVGPRWRIGARLRYASGNPITPTVGSYMDTGLQEYVPLSGRVLSERLPAFVQLDIRIDRSWKRRWGTLKLFLDVQNVTNRLNPEGVSYNFDYSSKQYTRGLPVFPSFGLEYAP